MIGLFQEHGPCRISNDSKTLNYNPYSWNNYSNVYVLFTTQLTLYDRASLSQYRALTLLSSLSIYIDQPIGVGYSYGTESVTSSLGAAEAVYQFLQIFFNDANFSKYATTNFALWTESYGGHYGPQFTE